MFKSPFTNRKSLQILLELKVQFKNYISKYLTHFIKKIDVTNLQTRNFATIKKN